MNPSSNCQWKEDEIQLIKTKIEIDESNRDLHHCTPVKPKRDKNLEVLNKLEGKTRYQVWLTDKKMKKEAAKKKMSGCKRAWSQVDDLHLLIAHDIVSKGCLVDTSMIDGFWIKIESVMRDQFKV